MYAEIRGRPPAQRGLRPGGKTQFGGQRREGRGERFAMANPSFGGSELSRLRPAVAGLRRAKEVRTGGNRQMGLSCNAADN